MIFISFSSGRYSFTNIPFITGAITTSNCQTSKHFSRFYIPYSSTYFTGYKRKYRKQLYHMFTIFKAFQKEAMLIYKVTFQKMIKLGHNTYRFEEKPLWKKRLLQLLTRCQNI